MKGTIRNRIRNCLLAVVLAILGVGATSVLSASAGAAGGAVPPLHACATVDVTEQKITYTGKVPNNLLIADFFNGDGALIVVVSINPFQGAFTDYTVQTVTTPPKKTTVNYPNALVIPLVAQQMNPPNIAVCFDYTIPNDVVTPAKPIKLPPLPAGKLGDFLKGFVKQYADAVTTFNKAYQSGVYDATSAYAAQEAAENFSAAVTWFHLNGTLADIASYADQLYPVGVG